ncbi:hypothetical protein NA57DRAFT_40983 [Rhizodiscina lignyota]|uniref:Zinc finger Mcm10/DnaG-type domain-containing protein n=1 Tax=Rhizodiscina lignyota TaxID=1504668 RepID=A0A9P4I8H5_9PEZI|nr:hypothetical protein NA57DRAFT_40983 [Rhizodiscina lignyota]
MAASPRKQPDWPPKSPLQALLSSPSGRERYQRRREGRSVSPSPIKRPTSSSKLNDAPLSLPSDEEDEDEDEETLQLKLKAIEAKLKLKKLQQAKAKQKNAVVENDPFKEPARPATATETRTSSWKSEPAAPKTSVQVPLSPTKDRRAPLEQKSPARVILGIDKGLKAQNVSLKRAASTSTQSNSFSRGTSTVKDRAPLPALKTFSERLAESRGGDKEKQEKADRIQKARGQGFGLNKEELQSFNSVGKEARRFERPEDRARSASGYAPRTLSKPIGEPNQLRTRLSRQELSTAKSEAATTAASEPTSTLESFSGLHLAKRQMPHTTLTRAFTDKALYTLPKLLKEVKGPAYEPPDVESDYVVLGIIGSKSTPKDHINGPKTTTSNDADEDARATGRNKFMALRLTDLKWEVDLFLFDSAFSQFWKLTPGTLIAILNPGIMPPKPGREATGAFALKLASSDDTVLEIGTARDLGFCKSIKSSGQECGSWVNAKKTEFCDFHVNLQVEKARATRMEVNTMGRFGKTGGEWEGKDKWTNSRYVSKEEKRRNGLLPADGREYDYETKESYYMVPGRPGRTAASILDDEEFGRNSFERGFSRDELLKKRTKERDKEMELVDKLGKIGNKAGAEYMRMKKSVAWRADTRSTTADQVSQASSTTQDKPDAASMGLLNRSATDVTLSPVKRKRGGGGTSSEPVGWGGAFKRGLLLSPKKDENSTKAADAGTDRGSLSPSKKRARFMLDNKGLREPGRDSLGLAGNNQSNDDDDDDDDDGLDII